MAYIRTIDPGAAEGQLARLYAGREAQAGRVWNIVRLMSLNPAVLRASMALYGAASCGPSPLGRALREMIAVVVSRANECHY